MYGTQQFAAIEVKNSDRVRPADLRGLEAFREDYPECKPLLLYRGADKLEVEGIPCWPVQRFLRELRPALWPQLRARARATM